MTTALTQVERRRKAVRLARFVLLGACLVMLYLLVDRFELLTLQEDAMAPAYPPGSRLLLDMDPREPRRGDTVVYEHRGQARTARVAALGGDGLEVREGILHVEGERTLHRIEEPHRVPERVPPGQLFLLNDNPRSRSPDSLRHGPVDPRRVRARVVTSIDFL